MSTIEAKWIRKHGKTGAASAEWDKMQKTVNTEKGNSSYCYCPTCGMQFNDDQLHEPKVHTWLTGHATVKEYNR